MVAEREPGTVAKVRKVQLSGGPVGRLVLITIVSVIAIAIIALLANNPIRFFCLLAVVGLVGFTIAKIIRHGKEDPVNAALDGAEITLYQQCLGTKAEPRILPTELVAEVVRAPERSAAATERASEPSPEFAKVLPEPSTAPESASDTESDE